MSDKPRHERTELAVWPVPPQGEPVPDFYEDEAYTAPVTQNDAAMIQFLASRARNTDETPRS